MKYRIFIGSSSEQLPVARAIETRLARDHEPTVWDEGIFHLSKDVLSGLIERLDVSDAAVFVLAPDDLTSLRNERKQTVRDNVIFELGLFIGRLGRERTFFVVPRGETDLHLPSDLLGLVAAEYDADRSDDNWEAAVSPACGRIAESLRRLQLRKPPSDPRLDVLMDGLGWMQDYLNKALKSLLVEEQGGGLSDLGIARVSNGYRMRLDRTDVNVQFGDIRTCDAVAPGAAVALPANEFFDDDCVGDTRSALGAYVQHVFPGRAKEVQDVLAQKLRQMPFELVERRPREMHRSYGIARCVYLDNLLSSGRRLVFTSITTQRPGVGLRSESRYLFAAMKAICQEMNDHRLTDLYLPVMGSGHGGMEPELALLSLLLSCKAVIDDSRVSGGHLRSITIVVFHPGGDHPPSIDPMVAERMLAVVKRMR